MTLKSHLFLLNLRLQTSGLMRHIAYIFKTLTKGCVHEKREMSKCELDFFFLSYLYIFPSFHCGLVSLCIVYLLILLFLKKKAFM